MREFTDYLSSGAFDQQFHHNIGGVTVGEYQGEDEEMCR
jgi:hypothetical protein